MFITVFTIGNAYKDFVGKPEGKTPLWRPSRRLEYNIKVDLKVVGCESVDWIHLSGCCE
jgi:hypothetical protein